MASDNKLVDPDEDALGKYGGSADHRHTFTAKSLVVSQVVSAFGNRPIDWMKRDLLAGEAGDDRRNFTQRAVLKNDSTFLLNPSDKLPTKVSSNAVREARAFDYRNRLHLLQMESESLESPTECSLAQLASQCPTSLYQTQVAKFGKSAERRKARRSHVCKNAWICPHCYARAMEKNYVSTIRRISTEKPAFVALASQENIVGLESVESFNAVCSELRQSLLGLLKQFGATGGLWTVQVGPHLDKISTWKGNAICADDVLSLVVRVSVMGCIPPCPATREKLKRVSAGIPEISERVSLDVFPLKAKCDQTLRAMFLKGRNKATARQRLIKNSHGLFYWPLMQICSWEQWKAKIEFTKSKKAVCPWGAWCSSGSRDRASKPIRRTEERGASRARDKDKILKLRKTMLAECGSNLGLGRKRLLLYLSDKGFDPTERDVRWIIKELTNSKVDLVRKKANPPKIKHDVNSAANDPECQPTNVPFLDYLLGGGTLSQGVYGIIGPTGVGKTTLATMIAVSSVVGESVATGEGDSARPWLWFDFESPRQTAMCRALSHGAQVVRSLEIDGGARRGLEEARGRLTRAKDLLPKRLRLLAREDLPLDTGLMRCRVSGFQPVEEIIMNSAGNIPWGGVVIDGLNNVWGYEKMHTDLDERRFIREFGDTISRRLASKLNCPVWLTHQASGSSCADSPLEQLSHENASICKQFAESLDACFALGTADDQGRFALQCVWKTSDRLKCNKIIVQHHETIASIVDVLNCVGDPLRRRWVSRG